MDWLNNLTNGENGSAINLVLITLAIAILLIVIVWIFRKITGSAARRAMRSRVPRLSITDSTTVDEKRYLVMVRRDNVEHLLLIGGANDIVVESNIVRAQAVQKPIANARAEMAQEEAIEQPSAQKETSLATPVAGAAAIGAAGFAAVTSTASSAVDTVTEVTTDAVSSIGETASNVAETVADKTSDIAETVTETVSDTASDTVSVVSNSVETVADNVSTKIEKPTAIEVPAVETIEEIEVPEVDLESAISAKLDDALSNEALDINVNETVAEVDSATDSPMTDPQNNNDDEMQRLLDELSGEVKEPAE